MRAILLTAILLFLGAGNGRAQPPLEMPGLERDAGAYARDLTRRFPAGAPPAARTEAEARARAAAARGDWPAAAAALEQRVGMPEPTGEQWLALARAQLNRTPSEPNRALQAAWQAFALVPPGPPEVAPLNLMAQALERLGNWAQAIAALEAAAERAPGDAAAADALARARRAAGLLVRGVRTEPDAEPARACISFVGSLAPAATWQPGDWVRAEPPIPNLAVRRENEGLCVAGLPWGRSTRLVLRAGLPGADGAALRADTPVDVAMPSRTARVAFDGQRFLLPRGQAARVGLATVNVRTLRLRLVRVTERNLVPFGRQNPLGEDVADYAAADVAESWGRTVWEGTAAVPGFRPDAAVRFALPLPDALRDAGPGLHVLVAREDGGAERDSTTVAGLQILSTDLGLTAWRGEAGLAAQLRSFADAAPRPGARVSLLARNNDVLAEADTDGDGAVRFDAPLLRGEGPMAPVALHARLGDDLVSLSLEAASFDLSDRGAEGRPHPGPLDAFLWLDRGIYRPGEVVNVGALLRDGAGRPAGLPLRLRLVRPNGQVAAEAVPPRGPDGASLWPATLSPGANAGQWTVEARVEPDRPPVGTASFRVDAFVPERLEVTLGPAPGPLVPGAALPLPVSARFLYGAPAAGLAGTLSGTVSPDPSPFTPTGTPAGGSPDGAAPRSPWEGWRFGLAEEPASASTVIEGDVSLGDDGRGTVSALLPRVPDATRPLRADLSLEVADPNGRPSRAALSVPVRGADPFVAIRPAFNGGSVDDGAEAAFDLALVSPDGAALSGPLLVRLVRERPDWRMVSRDGRARYETAWRDEPVDEATLPTAPGAPARFARALPFGRYRIEASRPGTLAIGAVRFRSGWVGSDSPEVPDKVDVSADRRSFRAGEVARIRVAPPFAGRASVAVLTDRLISLREVEVPAGGTEVTVPVDAAWGPGAHVAVTLFRPGAAAEGQPRRALGLAWVALDPAARRLDVAIEGEALLRPRGRVEIPVRIGADVSGAASGTAPGTTGPARLTLAAVDEGVLRVTRFASPDPVEHFTGRRRLGTDIRDDYGRLIPLPEGEAAALRQGGDENAEAGVQPPQRVVSLFSGIVEAGSDGVARVPLDLPDFNGELRLMAVAWSGERVGAASRAVTVRDPVVAEALLPRFLAPGDRAVLPVLLHNVELPEGEVAAEIRVEGPLALDGSARLAVRLATGARARPAVALRATGAGEAVLRLAVTGPGGFRAERESRITVRSSRPASSEVTVTDLAAGAEARIAPDLSRFVPGTARVRLSWGQPVRYDPDGLLRALLEYPLACAEQSASQVLALAAAPPSASWPAEARAAALGRAVASLLDKQRFDGAFSLWSANGEAEPWVSAYAAEALLRAGAAGAAVPRGALDAVLADLEQRAGDVLPSTPEERADQAYRLHVLALGGRPLPGAARRLFEQLDQLPTPLSRAQLGAALARTGDAARAEAAFGSALGMAGRRPWFHDYGSATRDALAVALLLREAAVLPARFGPLLANLPGGREVTPDTTSTQEQGWAVLLAAALNRNGRPTRVVLDGRELAPAPTVSAVLDGSATARNIGDRPVAQFVSVSGLPAQPPPAARNAMRVSRRFLTMAGADLNLDELQQNTRFVLLVEARAEDGEPHRALVQQGLPAGWEIDARLPAGEVPGMAFLGALDAPASVAALDDRFAAAADLTAERPAVRFAVVLRAVTPGEFELPGAQAQDMYRPGILARQNSGRISVRPPPG